MGFTIFFGVMNVIKFSHGDVFTFGAMEGSLQYGSPRHSACPIWSQFLFRIHSCNLAGQRPGE
ncbi:hypothetical protein ACOJBO_02080 [Rhizobium beringeri]